MSEPITKEQYEFFRSLYDEEERTSLQLEGRAKVYLGVISAFLAASIVKVADTRDLIKALHVPIWLLSLEALAMSAALLLVLWALHIRNFEAVNDGTALVEQYSSMWPDQNRFYEDRIVDYAVASSRNREINSGTAAFLAWAGWFIWTGIIILLVIVVISFWRS